MLMKIRPDNFKQLPQIPVYASDLAAYLILKGHLLDNQNQDHKRKNRWIYWFREDDTMYDHMNDYSTFREAMCLIREESKKLDIQRKIMYNDVRNKERGLEDETI